jgi:hypothetical protein
MSQAQEVKKCMTCGCDDLGNDHHYISDTEKCMSCVEKESAGAGRISGGVGFKLEYNVPDCQGGYAITKAGTGQVIGCYTTKEHAQEAMDAIAVNEPVVKTYDTTVADTMIQSTEDSGDDQLTFWSGSFSPFAHKPVKGEPMTPIYNSPTMHDGEPSVGYGNSSSSKGKSNQ